MLILFAKPLPKIFANVSDCFLTGEKREFNPALLSMQAKQCFMYDSDNLSSLETQYSGFSSSKSDPSLHTLCAPSVLLGNRGLGGIYSATLLASSSGGLLGIRGLDRQISNMM